MQLKEMESTIIGRRSIQFTDRAREIITFIICLPCLFLFAISAYDKIVDHERFLTGLSKVKYIGTHALFISWTVPIMEIIVSLLLLYPPSHKRGLYGFTGLMVLFTLYISSMLLWAEKLPCHCNLIIEKLSFGEHLVFNIGFIALGIFGLLLTKQKSKT
jgi:hypothetical protein